MKRRYLCVAVGMLAAGIVCFDKLNHIFDVAFSLMALVGLFLFMKNKKVYIIILSIMFLFGGLYGNYRQNLYKDSPVYEHINMPVSGKMFVKDIEKKSNTFVIVNATVTELAGESLSENVVFTIVGISDIRVNSVIHFDDLVFSLPERERNRGGFSYRDYLKSKGIYFTAIANKNDVRISGNDGFIVMQKLRTLKQYVAYRSEKVFENTYATQIIPAILTGSDILVSKHLDDTFKEAGISHILVASGMHISVIMLLCTFLLYPIRKYRRLYNILSALCLVLFGCLVGIHPSIIRATVTFFIYFFARQNLRNADSITVLFEASLIILIINPMSIYNLSFLLPFGAVFGILLLADHIRRGVKWLVYIPWQVINIIEKLPEKAANITKRVLDILLNTAITAFAVSGAAQIGILPVMLGVFKNTTVFSVFMNIIISFLMPFLYFFAIITLLFNLAPFKSITISMCNFIVKSAEITASVPGNRINVVGSAVVMVIAVLFVIFCILRCKKKWFEKFFEPLVVLCVVSILLTNALYGYIPKHKAEITFLNVEQGDCAIIRLSNKKTVIIDTGTEKMCQNELLPYLEREGIKKIDALILSHSDSDHSGGLKMLKRNVNVEKILTNRYFEDDIKTQVLEKDDVFYIENAKFTVLSPNDEFEDQNESSLVVRMDFGESSFLFTGDIGKKTEQKLENVDVDVLKVSHHGSKSSTSEEFLKSVSPAFSVISVSKNNSYGHPDENVLKRIKESGSEVLRTDEDYTLTFTIDLKGKLALTKGL